MSMRTRPKGPSRKGSKQAQEVTPEPGESLLCVPKGMTEALGGCWAVTVIAMPVGEDPQDAPARFVTVPIYDDPGKWGIILHDLVGHIANGYAHEGMDPVAAMGRILEIFDAERANPTGKAVWLGRK